MPATLLVLDIDGTLRPHGEPRVPKENVDALRTVQKAGVKLVIATGRCRAEIPAKMLRGIRPDYWICAAGAQVEDAAGTALYTSHMTAEEMYALVDFCEDYEHPLGFSFSDGGYVYLDYEAFHVQEKAAALEGCLKDGEDQDRHLLDMPFSAFGMLAAEDIAKFQAKYGYLGLQFLPYPRDGVRYPARRPGQGNRPAGTAGPSGPGRCGLRCRGRRSQRCRNAGAGRAFLLHGGRHENRQSCRQGAGPCRCTRWHCPAVPQSVAGDIPLNTKQPYTHVGPGLPPLYGAQAKALILGSFPSPKSRAQGFYYGHPQNRFWPLMATLTHSPTPAWEDLDAKRAIIIGSGLAVWDVIHACSIRGASDASIKDVEPNDLAALVNRLGVQAIFCNGATSGRLYRKYAQPLTGLEAVVLPSTSPANAAFTMPRLLDAWGTALEGYVNKP